MSTVISKEDLIAVGYPKATAQGIIREAKALMIQKGYAFYDNKRLGRVPKEAVEQITGIKF
ncbi:DUF3173 domain-containing protein [Bacillus cereus]|uniref:DUF3173 domain-containing protein n=1 Tax=Bacillus cereus group TaxID=86661 RepID=UPI001F56C293|nr:MULTISPECIES: DUF3173 domain-containing protein [Bacillus cereus group]MDF9505890.1 DUF3173 domain-containing protein [Bacillus cereus]MDF9597880.1 DUF3173 domain-containing protein [Bacillus cereus]MDF9610023.1 DUF3173 domain-containing protein [Bacillus cereus]MDF9661037.1 DUF3173 domain-containing protein [Bacillus cereus]